MDVNLHVLYKIKIFSLFNIHYSYHQENPNPLGNKYDFDYALLFLLFPKPNQAGIVNVVFQVAHVQHYSATLSEIGLTFFCYFGVPVFRNLSLQALTDQVCKLNGCDRKNLIFTKIPVNFHRIKRTANTEFSKNSKATMTDKERLE